MGQMAEPATTRCDDSTPDSDDPVMPEPSPETTDPLVRNHGLVRRLATRSGLLAVAGVLGIAGVAAAAVGAPVPIIGDAFTADDAPELVPVDEPVDEEAVESKSEDEEGSEDTAAAETQSEDPEEDDKENVVSAAAKSDCFKPDNGDEEEGSSQDVGGEPAAEVNADADADAGAKEDVDDCGYVDGYKNHGQFVSAVAHDRNLAKRAEKCFERGDRKCGTRLLEKTDKAEARATKKAERGETNAVKKAEKKANKGGGNS